jgi:hypothetical protein
MTRVSTLLFLIACSGSDTDAVPMPDAPLSPDGATGGTSFATLPLQGGTDAPLVANVSYKCATECTPQYNRTCIRVTVASVTDPQGFADLNNVQQTLRVFPDAKAAGLPEQQFFNVESYGIYFGGSRTGDYYLDATAIQDAACAANSWPMEVVATDASGHVTTGKFLAPQVL